MSDGASGDGRDDLEAWLERLADGRPHDATLGDLRALIALEGRRAEDSELGLLASLQAEQRAVQRLRARLIEARPTVQSSAVRRPGFARPARWAMPLLCVALLVISLPLYWGWDADGDLVPRDESPPTTRSAIQIIPLTDAAPLQRAQRIAAALKPEVDGLALYAHGDRVALDFEIAATSRPAAARAVKDEAIAQQLRVGTNRIELTRP